MSNAITDRLDLSTDTASELEYVKNYLKVGNNADDDLLGNLITSAKEDADSYLNNDFEETRPQVVVGSPDNGETIKIDDAVFTVASSTSVENREFADASGLVDCVNSSLVTVNGDNVGIPYITASNDAGTVTLVPDSDHIEDIELLTSDEIGLQVQYKVEQLSIPENIKDGVLKLIAHKYAHRVDGLESESSEHGGSGTMKWGEVKREYLQPYRAVNV